MNIYSVLFDRLSKVFGKNIGLTNIPEDDLNDGAFVTALIYSCILMFNLGSIIVIIKHFIDIQMKTVGSYILPCGILLMIFNYFYFVYKWKYIRIREEFNNLSAKQRKKYNIIGFVYHLGSPLLFFVLLYN